MKRGREYGFRIEWNLLFGARARTPPSTPAVGQAGGGLWLATRPDGSVTIIDRRRGRPPRSSTLVGWKAAVFSGCDRACTRAEIDAVASGAGGDTEEVTRFLDRCVALGVMVADGERWLALPVHRPPHHDPDPPVPARGRIPPAVVGA